MVPTDKKTSKEDTGKQSYQALCDSGHRAWYGPFRTTYKAAQGDANAHDKSERGGRRTAVVVS